MSTQWVNQDPEQQWQQPNFSEPTQAGPTQAGPTYSGQVLPTGGRPTMVAVPGEEETRLRMMRRWLFPIALVFAILTGAWWQAIVISIVVSMVLRHRIRQLRYQRMVASGVFGPTGPASASDLR